MRVRGCRWLPFLRSVERFLGSPSPGALLRAARGWCFCCGSSVLSAGFVRWWPFFCFGFHKDVEE